MRIPLIIGAIGGDGHGKTAHAFLESSLSPQALKERLNRIEDSYPDLDPFWLCEGYDEHELPEETAPILQRLGFFTPEEEQKLYQNNQGTANPLWLTADRYIDLLIFLMNLEGPCVERIYGEELELSVGYGVTS
jgi:hypothetical protein